MKVGWAATPGRAPVASDVCAQVCARGNLFFLRRWFDVDAWRGITIVVGRRCKIVGEVAQEEITPEASNVVDATARRRALARVVGVVQTRVRSLGERVRPAPGFQHAVPRDREMNVARRRRAHRRLGRRRQGKRR